MVLATAEWELSGCQVIELRLRLAEQRLAKPVRRPAEPCRLEPLGTVAAAAQARRTAVRPTQGGRWAAERATLAETT